VVSGIHSNLWMSPLPLLPCHFQLCGARVRRTRNYFSDTVVNQDLMDAIATNRCTVHSPRYRRYQRLTSHHLGQHEHSEVSNLLFL
jgi:hypothetical protein